MSNKSNTTLDMIAHQVMVDKGFIPDFPPDVVEEVAKMNAPGKSHARLRDLTHLLWVSIDNDDSEDLDQLTYAEKVDPATDRIFVAVADVNTLVKKDDPIDRYAGHNTTSVYTPTKMFPMLPLKLSTNLTSLNESQDRCAIVIESLVEKNGKFTLHDVYPALVRNQAKLAYNSVSAWLDGEGPLPEKGTGLHGFEEQLKLQDDIASRIREYREQQGALSFKTAELQPIILDGMPVRLEELKVNRGRLLIENFMIAANVAMTTFMNEKRLPVLRRVVRTPKRWDRIVALAAEYNFDLPPSPDALALQKFLIERRQAEPEKFADLSIAIIKLIGRGEYILVMPGQRASGHFDLALTVYSHATAPNRRYPDLVMQRLIKSYFEKKEIPYTEEDLAAIAANCTRKEDDAAKVERRVLKSAAAMVLQGQMGHIFNAMVSGVNEDGTWVRLINPPIEGKLIHEFHGLDVGDRLHVKLVHVDVLNGYIDFTRVHR